MGSMMMTVVLFIGVMAVASVVFGGWVLFTVVRLLGQGLGFLLGPGRVTAAEMLPGSVDRRCSNLACRCRNPISARFCRRCGRSLLGAAQAGILPDRSARVPGTAARWDPTAELAAGERNRI